MTKAARWCSAGVGIVALLTSCTRHVDNPQARPASLAAPITTLQVADLLSPKVSGEDGNLFVVAEPEHCAGLAREVDPPFLDAPGPLATDGGHWMTEDGRFYVEEMVAVYRSDFDPATALDTVRQTVKRCGGTALSVTTMRDRTYDFEVRPHPSTAPEGTVLWSLRAPDWNCDNLFVAAHNAAVEITTCGGAPGYDVPALAADALKRIEALADTTA
ncbi:sensor domain-containing protein [Mycobacterium sp. ZZG]